ncbi:hypothetical protein PLEOSDRAFT_1101196 [Pleurotus ostreatus PC15]|uniref:Uncharacterized protein n=2 Tax=Pleurotus TaxID=5320 RepID=A0A067P2U8_PLEO1|nr:hypothetical protein CCMSSC00406_0006968 [Pleurotus cornucopiae]KDQ30191.1 hypothetical protein PLEOSDRAFT_1101196 [Pleurotus ostreatus PC15]
MSAITENTPEQKLVRLARLLRYLPRTLPDTGRTSKVYTFLSWSTNPDYEDINENFKTVFGWAARSSGDGILAITERGESVCAVVDVLRKYLRAYPSDAILLKWVDDITNADDEHDSVDDGDNGMLRELAIEIEDDDFELDSEINLNAPVLRALLRGEATPAAQSASQPPAAKTCASITVEEAWKF